MVCPSTGSTGDYSAFRVPLGQHLLSGLIHGSGWFWRWLGRMESSVLREQIERTPIDRPIYVAGLPRAGSTVLLEILASHPDVVTHRYRDFWMIHTPVWWERFLARAAQQDAPAVERSHGDRLMVTPDSPEAMEEILWTCFFPQLHDPACCNVLDGGTKNPRFERFYRDHVRKLLIARGGRRYASKGNYNVTRLEYLIELFPDARIVLPVRRPREHVASLAKQHRLFLEAARAHPRSVAYLDRAGHFEFGAHRVPINAGDDRTVRQIVDLWEAGNEVRGWARYWAHIYAYVAERLAANPRLRDAVLVVRYEDLCEDSENVLRRLLDHCGLEEAEPLIRRHAGSLSKPSYYEPRFRDEEEQAVVEETGDVARRFGYGGGDSHGQCPATPIGTLTTTGTPATAAS